MPLFQMATRIGLPPRDSRGRGGGPDRRAPKLLCDGGQFALGRGDLPGTHPRANAEEEIVHHDGAQAVPDQHNREILPRSLGRRVLHGEIRLDLCEHHVPDLPAGLIAPIEDHVADGIGLERPSEHQEMPPGEEWHDQAPRCKDGDRETGKGPDQPPQRARVEKAHSPGCPQGGDGGEERKPQDHHQGTLGPETEARIARKEMLQPVDPLRKQVAPIGALEHQAGGQAGLAAFSEPARRRVPEAIQEFLLRGGILRADPVDEHDQDGARCVHDNSPPEG